LVVDPERFPQDNEEPMSRVGMGVRTFAVITTDANELVTNVHDRMPLIVAPEAYTRWLGGEPDPRDLMRLSLLSSAHVGNFDASQEAGERRRVDCRSHRPRSRRRISGQDANARWDRSSAADALFVHWA
jgi:hypothetical protein